ncbi:MAG TPA: hypothetical protein VKZ68_06760 [Ohtaekwangia sp.]|nr:hypothetical protein [Ohtaekwangia sp.]
MRTIKFLMLIMAVAMFSCNDESIRVKGGGDDDDEPILIPPPPDDESNLVPIDSLDI